MSDFFEAVLGLAVPRAAVCIAAVRISQCEGLLALVCCGGRESLLRTHLDIILGLLGLGAD